MLLRIMLLRSVFGRGSRLTILCAGWIWSDSRETVNGYESLLGFRQILLHFFVGTGKSIAGVNLQGAALSGHSLDQRRTNPPRCFPSLPR
jgi:hypothetical protein